MDAQEKVKDKNIIVCECGARISVSPNSKGICPACGRSLRIPPSRELSESSVFSAFDPQDTPPPSHSAAPTQLSPRDSHTSQSSNERVPMPDDGLDPTGKSTLTFVSDVSIRNREAANLVSRGKIVEAVALYRWICEEHPDHRDAYYGLGFCYYKLGDLQRSKWMLEKAVALEHPSAGKLLLKVNQKLDQEMLLHRKDEDMLKEDANKVAETMNFGDLP